MRRKSDWIYVAAASDRTKIGISYSPERRARQWQGIIGAPVRLVWCIHCPVNTRRVEANIMKELAVHRIHNEWFGVSPERAIAAVKRAVSGRGKRGPKPLRTLAQVYEQECARFGREAVDAALAKWDAPVTWPSPT